VSTLTAVSRPCVERVSACPASRGCGTTPPRSPSVVGNTLAARRPCQDDSRRAGRDILTDRSTAGEPLSQVNHTCILLWTSAQSNLTQGRIAATHSPSCQMAPMCTPCITCFPGPTWVHSPNGILTGSVVSAGHMIMTDFCSRRTPPVELSSSSTTQSGHHLRTVQTTAEGTPFSFGKHEHYGALWLWYAAP